MSLELAAQHLASRGRKGDSMLVHMAPQEVAGLQALAKAAGGTLTLNPDTGLPEANFLKRMLPMIIGAGLAAATGGTSLALTPGMIGLGLGGVETLRTGSLEKGLMAGLGAYGGAGLAGSLMGAGAAPLAGMEAAALENPAVAGAQATNVAGAGAGAGSGVVVNPVPLTPSAEIAGAVSNGPSLAQNLNLQAQQQAAQTAVGAAPQVATATPLPQAPPTFSQNLSQMGRGLKNPSQLMTKDNLKYGLAALSPTLQPEAAKPYVGGGPNYEYTYDPNTGSYTQVPVGTRDKMGKTPSYYAVGGPVEAMSDQNRMDTMMANGGQMYAGGGQINLQGTIDMGQGSGGGGKFGQANANGYQAAGGAQIQGFESSFGQMGGGMGGFDPRAVQANPQGFAQHMAQMRQREQQMPGSTMEAPAGGIFENGMMRPDSGGGFPGQQQALRQQTLSGGLAGYGQAMRGLGNMGGFDPRAVQANPQGFAQHMAQMQQREMAMPGSTMVGDMRYRPERDDAIIAANQASSNFASYAQGGMASMARGGPSHLGDYSDGGRLLKGPGDGVSDSIPATIANKRPARLADGEFVVPARIVSELGNGSTEAGARKLYAMMDRIQKARRKTTGKNRVAVNSRAEKLLPA